MKKMLIIIVVLAIILITMIIYKNVSIGNQNNINIQEIENIEKAISKIYLWKEVTEEALPSFEDINDVKDLWIWEVVKNNIEEIEIKYESIECKSKEIFGEKLTKKFPENGNASFEYNKENNSYLATEVDLDQEEDSFIILDIKKIEEKYEVEITEYLEDYSNENRVIIRNTNEEEIGQVSVNDAENKIQDIVKENIERFVKKKIYFNLENNNLIVEKVEKIQE